ncbi:putative F-box protein [Raphanus sativus]|uniref:F-box protein At5g42430 n=1 Tax=Raphanus sativus TaxID=3726 RepID=A0A6J0M753_RAPSA|nr:putative F-box protein At5g42430 [Raphanus sativus]KAJ4916963.1 putative F-box protein [Raphanus sativus]
MDRGGEISDSIPDDLIVEIFSRLPAKSAARFRCLSKLWYSMLHRSYFTELFLTRSRTRPRLLFVFELSGKFSVYSSPQLQNPYKKSSLVAPVDLDMMSLDFDGFTSGLIYFSSMYFWDKSGLDLESSRPVIYNPSTKHYVSLPKQPRSRHRRYMGSFLGFDPIDKQFKVLWIRTTGISSYKILTLGTGKMRWRNIQSPLNHEAYKPCLCINGVLYYLASSSSDSSFTPLLVCFDVRSEKFKFIDAEFFAYIRTQFINYKGRFGVTQWKNDGELRVWVLEDVEKQKWSKNVYTFPAINEIVGVAGATSTGDIVLSMRYRTSKPFYVFYFNLERNTLQSVEIQGFGECDDENSYSVNVFVDYVEDLNLNDAKYLNSIKGQNHKENSATTLSLKNKQQTTFLLNKLRTNY